MPLVDYILFLKDGEIVEQGKYSELVSKNEHFADFLKKDNISETMQIETVKDFSQNEAIW